MSINLCPFPFTLIDPELGDIFLPAADQPLVFEPRTAGAGAIKTLLGYNHPEWLSPVLTETRAARGGGQVIVPRLGPAIAVAREAGCKPLCLPLKYHGQRGGPSGTVALPFGELEPAPEGLSYVFPTEELDCAFPAEEIQRMVGGAFAMDITGVGRFAPVPQGTVEHPDGSVTLPDLEPGKRAVIVPNSGPSVRAAVARWPGVAVLVTGLVKDGKAPLYRVA